MYSGSGSGSAGLGQWVDPGGVAAPGIHGFVGSTGGPGVPSGRRDYYTCGMRQRIGFCTAPDGVRLAHATAGRGPPLVRVSNWLTHLEHDWSSPVWQHWLRAFGDSHTLIRHDMRGSGLSDRSAEDLSVAAWVADLETVVDDLGLDRFALLGLCQGGAIATAYAARHPERVSRLILYDAYVQGAYAGRRNDAAREQADALGQMIEVGWGDDLPAYRQLFASLFMPDASEQLTHALAELQRRTASPETARRLWHAFHAIDVSADAPHVRAPTQVFHVSGDAVVPLEQGRRLATLIPDARFVELDSRNHILLADEPAWPRFLDEARAFLAEDETADPAAAAAFTELTPRERAVLDRIARGLTNAEIAEALSITPKSTRNYVSRVFTKLGVEHRAQAVVQARNAGLGLDKAPS